MAGQLQGSYDLDDRNSMPDARDSLLAELAQADAELSRRVAEMAVRCAVSRCVLDTMPGHLPGVAASWAWLPDVLN